MKQLESSGTVTYAYLGVQGQTLTADVAEVLGTDAQSGVLVARVVGGSPAEKAGIEGGTEESTMQNHTYVLGGDVIQAVGDDEVTSVEDLAAAIIERQPGDTVTLRIVRDGSTTQVEATLAERPNA